MKLRREKNWRQCKNEVAHVEGVEPASHETIHEIWVKAGLKNPVSKPRKVWGKPRFEREHSNNLWPTDFKLTNQDEWMISFLDDHSQRALQNRIQQLNNEKLEEKSYVSNKQV